MDEIAASSSAFAVGAFGDERQLVGFAEARLRFDHVNGCTTSPVAFLEGVFVEDDARRRGVGRLLVQAVEAWASRAGCRELASDDGLRNEVSHRMHEGLGFAESERVVFYRKAISPP